MSKLEAMQKASKQFVDANVWDGEDRSGSNDMAKFDPDDLQELFDDFCEFWINE